MKPELIEEQFRQLQQTDATVKRAMDFGRAYGLDREHTLMLAVYHLASVNENLRLLTIRKLEASPVPVVLEDGGVA